MNRAGFVVDATKQKNMRSRGQKTGLVLVSVGKQEGRISDGVGESVVEWEFSILDGNGTSGLFQRNGNREEAEEIWKRTEQSRTIGDGGSRRSKNGSRSDKKVDLGVVKRRR